MWDSVTLKWDGKQTDCFFDVAIKIKINSGAKEVIKDFWEIFTGLCGSGECPPWQISAFLAGFTGLCGSGKDRGGRSLPLLVLTLAYCLGIATSPLFFSLHQLHSLLYAQVLRFQKVEGTL